MLLFTGHEGSGKSTVEFQILSALDPLFDAEHMHFTKQAFLDDAQSIGPRRACAWDEAKLNKRRAMHGDTLDILDFFQVSRGLNLYVGIAFPHESMLDSAVKDHRVRYNIHVERRGVFSIRVRVQTQYRDRPYYKWQTVGRFSFKENRGKKWRTYLAKKAAHMKGEDQPVTAEPIELGLRWDEASPIIEEIVCLKTR